LLNLVYFENCSFKVKIVGLLPYVAMTKLHFSSWTRFNTILDFGFYPTGF
jgi:hypothetical protein